MSMTELRAELDRRGLPKSGKKADLVARLEEAMSSDVPNSPTIPNGFDATPASELSKITLDIASFSPVLRTSLARISIVLFAASEPGRGSSQEQGQCVLDGVASIRQSLGLAPAKRKKIASPQGLIVRCVSDVVRDLSNKGALDVSFAELPPCPSSPRDSHLAATACLLLTSAS